MNLLQFIDLLVPAGNNSYMKKKLLVICPYPVGVAPSQRLKYEQYFDEFRNDGWDITVKPFINRKLWAIIYKKGNTFLKAWYTIQAYVARFGLLPFIRQYNVVYIHLWGTPFGPPLYEKMVRKRARKLVYDIDDLVYLKGTASKAHPLVGWVKGRKKPLYLMATADHVITCTPYLDEFVRRYNASTTDISSTVDTEKRYRSGRSYHRTEITIGWSGSLSTAKYFYLLAGVLKRLKEKYTFRILVMGDPGIKIPGLEIEALPWREEYEMEVLERFDIGVYPLPDEEWVYGKSGLKAIQYMALGIPTVASAIGANFRVIEDGVSGFLVNNDEEWLSVLGRLIKDEELRRTVGTNGRRKVEECFSIRANRQTYLKILNESLCVE
jgi:L-malate glycosyltransferase